MTASSVPRPDRLAALAPWLLLCSVLALHGWSILFAYTLDDHQAVLGHPAVNGSAPLWEVWTREFWGTELGASWSSSYRPMTSLMFAIEHRISVAPELHHTVNVLCFAGLCELLRRFALRRLSPRLALIAAIAFAALPVHVENVASIVGRADVLAALGALGAIAILRPRSPAPSDRTDIEPTSAPTRVEPKASPPPSIAACIAGACCFLVGLLSKETVILTPVLLGWLGLVAWRRREVSQHREASGPKSGGSQRAARETFTARFRALLPELRGAWVLLAVASLYMVVRTLVLPPRLPEHFNAADNLIALLQGRERFVGLLSVLGHYTELVFFPLRLCPDHTYADIIPTTRLFGADAVYAWLGVAVLLWLLSDLFAAAKGRSAGLWVATAIAYVLVGHWLIDLSVLVAERLMLWPSVWIVLALAGNQDAAQDPTPRWGPDTTTSSRLAVIAVGLVFIVASLRTVQRTWDWRDDWTLQQAAAEVCPRAVHSRFILANIARERGETKLAVWHYAVAGAGRSAYPGRFESPLLDVELDVPDASPEELDDRLARLPQLAGSGDSLQYWAALHTFLVSQGALAEARLVEQLAAGAPTP